MNRLCLVSVAASLLVLIGCHKPNGSVTVNPTEPESIQSTYIPPDAFGPFSNTPPIIERLDVPWPAGTMAVWGSLGRDHRGRIFVGASVDSMRDASAHLLIFDPKSNTWSDCGSVITRIVKPIGVSQNKIHTRILQSKKGDLFFASMDESGELDDGSILPTYGSHLWRMTPAGEWNLLKHVPEGIVAAAIGGNGVYCLGYFGHVLYRFDMTSGEITQTRIGATGGHVSRNFVVDDRGHAFVPRVRSGQASLVEVNDQLEEVAVTPLQDYDVSPNADSHGIVSWVKLKDGTLAIVTDGGRLYTVKNGTVTDRGRMHPDGPAYLPCLVCPDGQSKLMAIGYRKSKGEPAYEWIEFDLTTNLSTTRPIRIPTPAGATNVLIYGSGVRDDNGAWYLGGAFTSAGEKGFTPALWRVK